MDNPQTITHILQQHGLNHFGFTPLAEPLSLEIYKTWLNQNYHGEMTYLKTHLPIKETPQKKWPKANSAIVLTFPYKTDLPNSNNPFPQLNIASYAQDYDYHFTLKQKMNSICRDLQKIFPGEEFLGFTDSSPILERDLAYRAGLGWFGKNSCLIDRKHGSFFFIAEILTSLDLSITTSPSADHCGTCTRCIEACPTQALNNDKTMDATRCISYWTIEAKTSAPEHLLPSIGDHFFGCDICQDVCPWNIKWGFKPQPASDSGEVIKDLKWILTSSHNQILKRVQGTPLARAGAIGLKRNAMVVAAHLKAQSLREDIAHCSQDERLKSTGEWSLAQLQKSKA